MKKRCIRCNNEFNSNEMIVNDDVCDTCDAMNCITFWYPRLYRLSFPMPKTIIIHTNVQLIDLFDNKNPEGLGQFMSDLKNAVIEVGLPAFLRTGHLSNKHDWKNSCYINEKTIENESTLLSHTSDTLLNHVHNLLYMSCIATIDRVIPFDFWAVREFIKTEPYFHYFIGEMPITKERRFFVRNGKIECHHNYWDRKAFENDIDEKLFDEMASLSNDDENELIKMATYVAKLFSGYWSLDFLKGANGEWYLTDMAIGEKSHHPECKKIKQSLEEIKPCQNNKCEFYDKRIIDKSNCQISFIRPTTGCKRFI